jgi:hypothetical protein
MGRIVRWLLAGMMLLAGCASPPAATRPPSPVIGTSPPGPIKTNTSAPASPPTPTSGQPTLEIAPLEVSTIRRYDLLELDILTSIISANPYNPDLLDIHVLLESPSGKEVEAGAFWYQDFDLRTRAPEGEAGWKVRFTPTETGRWMATAYIPALDLHSEPVWFNVVASGLPGFVRVNPANPRYLAYDNGDFFFPIGLNMGWWGGCCDPIDQYHRWLDAFSSNGGNTIRVWMAAWSFGIEWNDTPLGDYSNRMVQAWLLDQLFRLAETHGVHIILVLINHGQFSPGQDSEWKQNPYNAALGGPISGPEQFVTDPLARALFKQRLNYIVNRWGYSPNLLAWEWWNEVNLTPISDKTLIPWLQEMTAYLRQRDVNQHLTTNSYAIKDQSSIWQLPELDIVSKHEYANQVRASERDLAGRAAQDFQALAASIPAKPVLLAEFGYSAANYGDDIEKTGIHLHNGIWATTFSGYAGSGMYWWWDTYVETYHLWYHFNGLAGFIEEEDLTQYQPFSPPHISATRGASAQAIGMGLRGKDILIWLRCKDYTVQGSIASRPVYVENQILSLDEMAPGEYNVRWYSPQTGSWLDETIVSARNGTLNIPIPPFYRDIAAKIAPADAE